MSLETEAVLDRRRLRRSMSFWRAIAVLALALALGAVGLSAAGGDGDGGDLFGRRQIARVTLDGMITENRAQLELLGKLAREESVEAVILYINSPGGTTAGGEALFNAIRDISARKPIVAQFGTIATSAAYMAGIAADQIFAHGSTITGSVGVIFQWADFSDLMGKVGVKMNEVKSGRLKAVPSPFRPLDEAGRETTERMVAESMGWFRGLVANRRTLDTATVPGLDQGAIYSGREALRHKLIDGIGGEQQAVAWLVTERGVTQGLKVVDRKPKSKETLGVLGMTIRGVAAGLGLGEVGVALTGGDTGLASMRLGGLVSIWQPIER